MVHSVRTEFLSQDSGGIDEFRVEGFGVSCRGPVIFAKRLSILRWELCAPALKPQREIALVVECESWRRMCHHPQTPASGVAPCDEMP